ncbi:GMC oxidoreductase [Polyporus arcularius HHB13444]|uniref:GMC oxidoreductase n=1 Tax=Polyporus arcularius HHB13444 TaxID=1314778 RepID=A0A5C3P7T0_9APHY|nr:GMC oxidoreductase [Polyporus arcularius HHB13444]
MTAKLTAVQFGSTTFDYIVIGGGTAGLTVAARLSEDPATKVGVLEAGDWDPNIAAINLPGLAGSLMGHEKHDWGLVSVPQIHANGQKVPQPRGKGLGGSSLINITLLDRASAAEYDGIEALGNPGWNWNEFLKYFKKSETTIPTDPDHAAKHTLPTADTKWHGDSGPLLKSYPLYFGFGQLRERVMSAPEELGVPSNPDANDGNKVGVSTTYVSVDPRNATRSYAANVHFQANSHRDNLFVLTSATVSKVIFREGTSPLVATGVEFIHEDQKYRASASKEVIVSAGSLQTPQILELSGIGNKKLLSKYEIATLVDLPSVGENLQVYVDDHVSAPVVFEIDPQYETLDAAREPGAAASLQQLYQQRQGPLSAPPLSVVAFFPSETFMSPEQRQKWKEGALAAMQDAPEGLRKQYEVQIRRFAAPSSPEGEIMPVPGFLPALDLKRTPKARYLSICTVVLHPLSRGSVHIASADPQAPPTIDPAYLSRPEDLEVLLAAVKFSLAFFKTTALGDVVRKQLAPAPEVAASDDALRDYIKETCSCVYHPLGTAAMLPKQHGGVVDPELKVYGTANLRVVDASILPMQIAAHTQATVYAIAERASDIIRGV